jgi:TolB-like protein
MHDLHEEGKTLFITMEYVWGEDLKSVIRRMKALAVGTAVSIARQVAEGLGEAHRLGVVHRDLKPSNIMIDKDGNAKIMDFGIARSLAGAGTTAEGAIIGTPEYMSPEQVGGKPADERADIYSLGVIFFEMVTGHPPFEGETSLAIAHKHRYEPPPDPQTLNPQMPVDLSRLILRCLEIDRKNRYQTTTEFQADLEAVEASLPTAERVPGRRPSRIKPKTSREITVKITPRKLLVPFLALIVIIAAIIGLRRFFLSGQKPSLDSIAVLPFRYLAEDKEKEYWADAMTDALIGKLGQVTGLKRVISMRSSIQYKNSTKKASEIARELGVNCILEGSIFQVEDRVRISVQLIDARTDRHIWANDCDKSAKDVFTLQNEVTKAVASEINVKLTPHEETRLAKARPINPAVLDSLVKSQFYSTTQYSRKESLKIIVESLKKIIDQDPGFAQPHVALALYYWNMPGSTPTSPMTKHWGNYRDYSILSHPMFLPTNFY